MSFYAVVEFPDENGATAVISSSWLRGNDNFCCWPTGPNCNISKLAEKHAKVETRWTTYPCKVLGTFGSFKSAKKGCKRTEYTSHIESSATENTPTTRLRKRKCHQRLPNESLEPTVTSVKRNSAGSSTSSSCASSGSESDSYVTNDCPTTGLLQAPINRDNPPVAQLGSEETDSVIFGTPRLELVNHFTVPNSTSVLHPPVLPFNTTPRTQFTEPVHPSAVPTASSSQLTPPPPPFTYRLNEDTGASYSRVSEPCYQSSTPHAPRSFRQSYEFRASNMKFALILTETFPFPKNDISIILLWIFLDFEKKVLQLLLKILENQTELLRRLGSTDNQETSRCNLPIELPITNIADLRVFNQWLETSENNLSLRKELSVIGGQSIPSITTKLLSTLMTNELASFLSLTGKGKKTQAGIQGTPLIALIYGTVRLTKGGETATNTEVDKAMQKWLKGASDRDGGRKRRKTATCTEHNEDLHSEPDEGND
ncbi:unnamed protein product [Orchesella dallaii]|uniref:DUF4806 domain-containing protein n=1 Tax=Orchesella dallaii TaxID=48710 RepID=A0ABP1RJA5_9HEXA